MIQIFTPMISAPASGTTAIYITIAGIGASLMLIGGYAGFRWKEASMEDDLEEVDGIGKGTGFEVQKYKDDKGILSTAASAYYTEQKKDKALSEGYVRWHLIDSSMSSPMYVSPEREAGGNVAELKKDGETYLFPKSAMVPSEEEGVPVVVHRKGEADPVDLSTDWDLALDAKTLQEYLTQRVTSTEPESDGWNLPNLLNMDPMSLLQYLIIGIIVAFILLEVV